MANGSSFQEIVGGAMAALDAVSKKARETGDVIAQTAHDALAASAQLQQTLEGVAKQASATKTSVEGVFTDYVGDTEPLEPDRGGPV